MLRRFSIAVTLASTLALPAVGRAATVPVGVSYVTNAGWRYTPAQMMVSAADTIVWSVPGCTGGGYGCQSHSIEQYWGGGPGFDSGSLSGTTYSRTAGAGAHWYRCEFHSQMVGPVCNGMCGSYTDAPSGPSAPVINQPPATVTHRFVTVAGTTGAWMLVSVSDGSMTYRTMSDGSGAWSLVIKTPNQGAQTYTATVLDAAGRSSPPATRSATVTWETTPPTVSIANPGSPALIGPTSSHDASGGAGDSSGIAGVLIKVTLAGDPNPVLTPTATCSPACPSGSITWSAPLAGLLPGVYTIYVVAVDTNANQSSVSKTFVYTA